MPGNAGGESETIIGRWLAARGHHDDLVIMTKVGMAGGAQPKGLTREIILRAADESLQRLGTDRIDVYWAHEDDAETDLRETLGAFDELVRQGLVTTIAASNYPTERLAEALALSESEGLVRFEGLQPRYNLLDRDQLEGAPLELCREAGLGVTAFYSLARGFLTGKYRAGRPLPSSQRAAAVVSDYMNDRGFAVLAVVDRVAEAHDATPAQVALAWVMARPGITCAISSATSAGQATELTGAMDLRLAPAEMDALDAAGAAPSPR